MTAQLLSDRSYGRTESTGRDVGPHHRNLVGGQPGVATVCHSHHKPVARIFPRSNGHTLAQQSLVLTTSKILINFFLFFFAQGSNAKTRFDGDFHINYETATIQQICYSCPEQFELSEQHSEIVIVEKYQKPIKILQNLNLNPS